jgi:hypothetical protein
MAARMTDMATLADIVVDCARPASVARFWAAALDDYSIAPYDQAEIERLRALGIDDVEDDPTVLLAPATADRPRIWFQRVPEAKSVKNRVHLDLRSADVDGETRRLVDLGAWVVAVRDDLTVLADPEGNEFCLIR